MLPYNDNVIRANPLIKTYRALFFFWMVLFVFFSLFVVTMVVISIKFFPPAIKFSQLLSFSSIYTLPLLLYFSSFVSTIWQSRYWKRIEQGRFAAVRGDHSLLAVEQPVANPLALQLPYTLKSRPGKGVLLIIIGITLVLALLLAEPPAWFNQNFRFFSPDPLHNFLIIFAITASVLMIIMLAIFFSPLGTQKIVVTEQDLSVRAGGQKSTIRWEEVRLFAMYNTLGRQKSGSIITYELSSTTDIVRWARVVRQNRFHVGMMPTIPIDEYNWRMQGLNMLVVARTGLPLSDLRTVIGREGSYK